MKLKKYEDYKYHATMTAVARCALDETTSKMLAVASLEDLKSVIPKQALTEGFEDLLPIAANACVVNMGNKRGDMISTATALEIYKGFSNKYINIEHDRKIIVGHVVNTGLSKFHTNWKLGVGSEPVKEEALASTKDPFNISLAGYIYAVAYPDVVKKIMEANDPESDSYLTIGFSWELAFDSHKIAIGSRSLSEAEIIDDPEEIEKYSKYLKCNKGTGKLEDGREVYRLIDEGVVPLGVALTFAPAADVTGVFTTQKWEAEANQEAQASEQQPTATTPETKEEEKVTKTEQNLSQQSKANVTTNTSPMKKTLKTFADLKALNDENVGEYSLANVGNLLEAEIEKVAKEHQKKVEAEASEKAELKKKADDALASVETLNKQVKELQEAQARAEATNSFNERMQSLDEGYELNDAQRKAVASQIKGLDDAAYASWKTNFEAFAAKKAVDGEKSGSGLNGLKGGHKVKNADDETDDNVPDEKDAFKKGETKSHKAKEEKKKAKASESDEEEQDSKEVAAEALAKANEKKEAVANTADTQQSLKDKYAKAFSTGDGGGLEIVTSSRR